MKLLLVRHAEAFALGEHGITQDYDRPLTELGLSHANALAESLADLGILPDVVMTSPFVRAMQTAMPLANALTPGTPPVVNDELRLESLKPKRLVKTLPTGNLIILVGHQPDLGQFAGWLLGCGGTSIDFAKGSAGLFACGKLIRKGRAELRWLMLP